MNRLEVKYQKEVVPALKKELSGLNIHEIPRIQKVVLNVGVGKFQKDKRYLETASNTLRIITGQHPVQTKAKKAIAGFKLREDSIVGIKVTLRGKRMYDFLDRFVNIVLPRFRDFRGVSQNSFDASGNYSIGVPDQSVFPELSYDDMPVTHGLQITIVTNTEDENANRALLKGLGMPFSKENK